MTDKQNNEKRAIEALTGLSVECAGIIDSHDEDLTANGARSIINALETADLKIVPVEP